jgi:hypothetical protein
LFGAQGYYVEHADQIGDTVQAALRGDKPAVIEYLSIQTSFPPRQRRRDARRDEGERARKES